MFTSKPCPVCFADVRLDARAEKLHEQFHAAISAVAIESTKRIDLLVAQVAELQRRIGE